jgi:hypothetical protein
MGEPNPFRVKVLENECYVALKQFTILIVEDFEDGREMLKFALIAGLKIRCRKDVRFDSRPRHHSFQLTYKHCTIEVDRRNGI